MNKRVRIEKPKARRGHTWAEVLPLDPRDSDVLRAKGLAARRAGGETATAKG